MYRHKAKKTEKEVEVLLNDGDECSDEECNKESDEETSEENEI